MSNKLSAEKSETLKNGGSVVISGKYAPGKIREFITHTKEKIKGYCESHWSNGDNYKSNFRLHIEPEENQA